jgi:hypothetical protein
MEWRLPIPFVGCRGGRRMSCAGFNKVPARFSPNPRSARRGGHRLVPDAEDVTGDSDDATGTSTGGRSSVLAGAGAVRRRSCWAPSADPIAVNHGLCGSTRYRGLVPKARAGTPRPALAGPRPSSSWTFDFWGGCDRFSSPGSEHVPKGETCPAGLPFLVTDCGL